MNAGSMRNGHIVGERFLELIANTKRIPEMEGQIGQIYCWPTTASSITQLVLDKLKASSFQMGQGTTEIKHYPPVHISKNHKYCKFTFACHICDDQVLKPTDSVQRFDPQDRQTVFKLGLRTFAAYTAWYDGHKRWAKEGLLRNKHRLPLLRQHPFLQPAFEALSEWGARRTSVGRELESEMQRWRSAYQNSSWNQVASHVIEVSVKPRIAACGIQNWSGYTVALIILPNNKGTSFIIATTLLESAASPSLPSPQRTATQELAKQWKRHFADQPPEQWLPQLSNLCEFFYVSPEDYLDPGVISERARLTIATKIGSRIAAIPDITTDDPHKILLQLDPP